MNLKKWHQRFLEQASWTKQVRHALFEAGNIPKNSLILEVGSGTGAILSLLKQEGYKNCFGIDIDFERIQFANQITKSSNSFVANGQSLPFSNETFDIVFCHYLLLWVHNPQKIVNDMERVAKRGGKIMFFAEPDYHTPIKRLPELEKLRTRQIQSLQAQGANTQIGRELKQLLQQSNLTNIHVGIIDQQLLKIKNSMEWEVFLNDIQEDSSEEEEKQYKKIFMNAFVKNEHINVSTFYAIGYKK